MPVYLCVIICVCVSVCVCASAHLIQVQRNKQITSILCKLLKQNKRAPQQQEKSAKVKATSGQGLALRFSVCVCGLLFAVSFKCITQPKCLNTKVGHVTEICPIYELS